MAVSILYLRSHWLLNGPPRHLLSWGPKPLGAQGAQGGPREPKGRYFFKKNTKIMQFCICGLQKCEKKVEIEGAGPPWRDSHRNSAPGPSPQVPKFNGATATHLVTKRCDLGSLGVPGRASTPLGSWPKAKGAVGDHSIRIVLTDTT